MSLIVYVRSVHAWVSVSSSNQSTGQFYNDELFYICLLHFSLPYSILIVQDLEFSGD